MIYELEKSQFGNIKPLLKGDLVNLEIKAVVDGFNPGWVFVDNKHEPKTAMVWSKGIKGFYFVGNESNNDFNDNINDYIDSTIAPRAKAQGLNSFEFSTTSLEWDEIIEEIFKNREFSKSRQYVYKNKKINEEFVSNIHLDTEFKLKRIDRDLLNSDLSNLDFLKSIILEWWISIEKFLENGVGYCILQGSKVVSCSCASFVTDNSMESHIVTLKDYRKRGLAKKAVSRFLKYCNDNKYEPYWDCMEENISSRALAESLGYTKDFEYNLYEFRFNK